MKDNFIIIPPSAATYDLVTADGRSLPRTRSLGGGTSITLLSDVLVVFEDRRYERTTVIEAVSSSLRAEEGASTPTEVGQLVPFGNRFVMQFECGDDLRLCVPPDTIAFTASGAFIERSYLLSGSDLQYRIR